MTPHAAAVGNLLQEAREHDRAGRVQMAIQLYSTTIRVAEGVDDRTVLAEALRRFGVLRYRQNEAEAARGLCQRSHDVALAAGDRVEAAEALNTLAGFDLEGGSYETARTGFGLALELGTTSAGLRGRIEQNLGILANIQGDVAAALTHYERSLAAFQTADDEPGCALAFHNLGMLSADQKRWEAADGYFRQSLAIAERIGDVYLRGLCLLNHTEVHLARQRYQDARQHAEEALRIFDQLGARDGKAAAYRFLGVLYRETGSPVLSEARLRTAVQLADEAGHPLEQAEAARELALLYQGVGRNQDALRQLNLAHRLFRRIDARAELVDVAAKVAELEGTYLAIIREWGQSIESADSYTFGHCERVAGYALAVARALALPDDEMTTIRLGAYLHDVGKVRIPHEILNKPSRLTREEFEVIQQHPVWGIEMLAAVEFPWDIKPIIRWHHEKYDGSGYPDRLQGDEIPVHAQIICVVDVYDALTTARSYKPALLPEAALAEMTRCRHWWRSDVFAAFLTAMAP